MISITGNHAGQRLDVFLADYFENRSRSFINKAIKQEKIKVNGKNVKSGYVLKERDALEVVFPELKEMNTVGQEVDFTVVYEDDHCLAVNKPPGVVVHPSPATPDHTLVNGLIYRQFQLSSGSAPFRPGIIHRIDKDTSGLLLVAKNEEAHCRFADLFKDRKIEKYYLAYTWGSMNEKEGEIDKPIGRSSRDRTKMTIGGIHPREAQTRFEVIRDYGVFSLLKIRIITGRTHQIRVHFQDEGHPVLGDTVYGAWPKPIARVPHLEKPKVVPLLKRVNRQLLHSWKMVFIHPFSGEEINIEAGPPKDFFSVEELDSIFKL